MAHHRTRGRNRTESTELVASARLPGSLPTGKAIGLKVYALSRCSGEVKREDAAVRGDTVLGECPGDRPGKIGVVWGDLQGAYINRRGSRAVSRGKAMLRDSPSCVYETHNRSTIECLWSAYRNRKSVAKRL